MDYSIPEKSDYKISIGSKTIFFLFLKLFLNAYPQNVLNLQR